MTPEQEFHLENIKDEFLLRVDQKYRAGAKEHGGDLWKKPGVVEMLLDEIIDLYVYAYTLKEQRDNPELIDPNWSDIDSLWHV